MSKGITSPVGNGNGSGSGYGYGKEVCEVYHPGNDIGLVREYAKETGIEDAARA